MTVPLRTLLLPLLGALLPTLAAAQTEHGGRPVSERALLVRPVPTLELPPVDAAALRAEDERRGKTGGLRFGEVLPVDLSLASGGAWEELADGGRVWRARVHSPGAYSLSLMFSRFQLPPEGELFVYDDRRAVVRGAYTSLNQTPEGGFAIQPIPGDALTLEYHVPAGSSGLGELALQAVVHDYVDITRQLGAGVCNLDVACAPALELQIRATVRTLAAGVACTAVLLNSTANDGTQLLLCSEHCGDLTNAVFLFQFQRQSCGDGPAPTNLTVQGSKTLVKNAAMDYQLVRVRPQIPATHAPYLAGWSRSTTPPPFSFGIHHPQGDPKAVCVDLDPPTIFGGRWRIGQWEVGTTEGGSSGSGLFDPAGLLIGTLEGGFATCADPSDDRYVRMDVMWTGLAPFLDPLGTGATSVVGYDPLTQPVLPLAATATAPAQVPVLQVGPGRDVNVLGTGFDGQTTLALDGVPVPAASYGWVNPQTIEVDLPQVAATGTHTLMLTKGMETASLPFEVVPVPGPAPVIQVGTGVAGNQVVLDVPWLLAAQPNELLLVTYSTSPTPSSIPVWTVPYGNQFTQLEILGFFTMPAGGVLTFNTQTTGFFQVNIYAGATLLNGVYPALQSNLAHFFVFL